MIFNNTVTDRRKIHNTCAVQVIIVAFANYQRRLCLVTHYYHRNDRLSQCKTTTNYKLEDVNESNREASAVLSGRISVTRIGSLRNGYRGTGYYHSFNATSLSHFSYIYYYRQTIFFAATSFVGDRMRGLLMLGFAILCVLPFYRFFSDNMIDSYQRTN